MPKNPMENVFPVSITVRIWFVFPLFSDANFPASIFTRSYVGLEMPITVGNFVEFSSLRPLTRLPPCPVPSKSIIIR